MGAPLVFPEGQIEPGSDGAASPSPPQPGHMARIPGGVFTMGSDAHYPEERPARRVRVDGFRMDRRPVTNAVFKRFADGTGYATIAERPLDPSMYPDASPALLVPGALVFHMTSGPVDTADVRNWWRYVPGACWRRPEGLGTDLAGREDHPVVHVAWDDALAYAEWAGKSLPTEAEWEFAARGGLDGAEFVWGAELTPGGRHMANTWQGPFPWRNFEADGFAGTSPVNAFPPNGYGLHDMAGNVWEWTADWYAAAHPADPRRPCCVPENPRGPPVDRSYDARQPKVRIPRKVVKGGSHLCGPSYCRRYRPAARQPQMVDSAMGHLGFRCVVRDNEGDDDHG